MNTHITCPICFKLLKKITNNHLCTHNITYTQFKILYPTHATEAEQTTINNKLGCKNRLYSKERVSNTTLHNQLQYNNAPKFCVHCNEKIPFNKRRNTFCNSTCSASYNNKLRDAVTKHTKEKCSHTTTQNFITYLHKIKNYSKITTYAIKEAKSLNIPYSIISHYESDDCYITEIYTSQDFNAINKEAIKEATSNKVQFCKIYHLQCNHCGSKFINKFKLKYCPSCVHLYYHKHRQPFQFKFNIYNYPDLFNISYLNTTGWFSNGGKNKSINPNGLSRDHKVSVNEAIRNNYDPYYISHPLNCDLIPQTQNNIKKTKSSISYTDLINNVQQYDISKTLT